MANNATGIWNWYGGTSAVWEVAANWKDGSGGAIDDYPVGSLPADTINVLTAGLAPAGSAPASPVAAVSVAELNQDMAGSSAKGGFQDLTAAEAHIDVGTGIAIEWGTYGKLYVEGGSCVLGNAGAWTSVVVDELYLTSAGATLIVATVNNYCEIDAPAAGFGGGYFGTGCQIVVREHLDPLDDGGPGTQGVVMNACIIDLYTSAVLYNIGTPGWTLSGTTTVNLTASGVTVRVEGMPGGSPNIIVVSPATAAAGAAAAQLVIDRAAVDAVKTKLLAGTTLLTKTGSLTLPLAPDVQADAAPYGIAGSSHTPSYPTTATSQAAQLLLDKAAVQAQAASILNTATILTIPGTFDDVADDAAVAAAVPRPVLEV